MRPLLLAGWLLFVLAAAAGADPGTAPETTSPSTATTPVAQNPPNKVPPPASAKSKPKAAAAIPSAAPARSGAAAPEALKKAQSPPPAKSKPKADTDKATRSRAEMRKVGENYLKLCLRDWDAATHMTRTEWDRTCRRVAQDRVQFMIEQMDK